jgi:hypothetical protein
MLAGTSRVKKTGTVGGLLRSGVTNTAVGGIRNDVVDIAALPRALASLSRCAALPSALGAITPFVTFFLFPSCAPAERVARPRSEAPVTVVGGGAREYSTLSKKRAISHTDLRSIDPSAWVSPIPACELKPRPHFILTR